MKGFEMGEKIFDIPTIGRWVHYVIAEEDLEHFSTAEDDTRTSLGDVVPALVTFSYGDGAVDLTVFVRGGESFYKDHVWNVLQLMEGMVGNGTWHWPPRV